VFFEYANTSLDAVTLTFTENLTTCSFTLKPEKHKMSLSIVIEYNGLGFFGSACTLHIPSSIMTTIILDCRQMQCHVIKVGK